MNMQRPISIQTTARVRFALVVFLLFMLMVAMIGCDSAEPSAPATRHEFPANLEEQRAVLRRDLSQLSRSIELEIEKVREVFARSGGNEREMLLIKDRKLKSNLAKTQKAMNDIEYCAPENWESVRLSTVETTKLIKSSHEQLAYQLEE